MKLNDYLRLGWEQLRRRIVVTMLCAMGIAIGSASIIVALAFGESVNHYSKMQMSMYLKTDEMTVFKGRNTEGTDSGDPNAAKPYELTKAKVELMKSLPHVKAAATYQTLNNFEFTVDNKRGALWEIIATDLDTLDDFGVELQQGKAFDQDNAIILSYGATMGLFDEQMAKARQMTSGGEMDSDIYTIESWQLIPYPMYQKQIMLTPLNFGNGEATAPESIPLRVIGILKKPQGVADDMIMGQKTAYVSPALGKRLLEIQERMNGGRPSDSGSAESGEISQVRLKIDDTDNVRQVEELVRKLKLRPETNLRQQERMNEEMAIIRLILGGAGLFILFVASISIIVAMTMSTYQRRRQIGIMKVLGANLRQIRNMFMIESALLGLLGGFAGILLSYWVIWGINIAVIKLSGPRPGAQEEILFISPWILPLGLFFAVLTGIVSGIYPAVKASRTDALTAIKRD